MKSVEPVLREADSYSDRTLVAFGDLAVAAKTQLPIYLAAPDGNLYVMYATNLKRVGDSVVWDYVVRCVMSGLPKDETIFDCGK